MEQFDFNFFGEEEDLDFTDPQEKEQNGGKEQPPAKVPLPSPDNSKTKESSKKDDFDNSNLDDYDPFPIKEEGTQSEEDDNPYTVLAKNFFDYLGWDNWSDDFLPEKNAEGFFNMLESIIQENSKPEYSSEIVRDFDTFVKNGGNPKEFLETYNQTELPELDLENQEHQAYVVYQQMKMSTQWSDEKIRKYVHKLAKDGELAEEAKDAFGFVKSQYDQRREQLKKQQEEDLIKQNKETQEYIYSVGRYIESASEEDLGVSLTKGEKQKFVRFLLEPDPKTGLTPYQHKIQENPSNSYKLAALVFKGALDGQLESIAKKKVVNELEDKLKKSASNMFGKKSNKMNVTPNNEISFSDLF